MAANVGILNNPIVRSVESVSREEFRTQFVGNIIKFSSFSRIICLGMDTVSEKEKASLRKDIKGLGIPISDTDEDLNLAVRAIMDRASALR